MVIYYSTHTFSNLLKKIEDQNTESDQVGDEVKVLELEPSDADCENHSLSLTHPMQLNLDDESSKDLLLDLNSSESMPQYVIEGVTVGK